MSAQLVASHVCELRDMVVVFFAKEIYQAAKNTLTVLSRVALLV
jgi:hypothetical protein